MPDRWTVERAVQASELAPVSRLIMLTLLTRADTRTAILPLAHTPSLTVITEATGLDRATVRRHLNRLEAAGWLTRCRPPVWLSRTKHARTGYHCQLPGLGALGPQARCTVHLGLGAPGPSELGAPCPSDQTDITDVRSEDALTALVIAAVLEATGRRITPRDAMRGIRAKLDGRNPRDPARYLAAVIAQDPRWWLPTSQPPAYEAANRAALQRQEALT